MKQKTPRSMKRFMNRVRYLAMRQREYAERKPLWKSLLARLERGLDVEEKTEPINVPDTGVIPEPALVALSAIQQLDPRLILNEQKLKQITSGMQLLDADPDEPWQAGLQAAIKAQRHAFPDLPTLSVYRESFLRASADIRVN
jgi:hypothetical protein